MEPKIKLPAWNPGEDPLNVGNAVACALDLSVKRPPPDRSNNHVDERKRQFKQVDATEEQSCSSSAEFSKTCGSREGDYEQHSSSALQEVAIKAESVSPERCVGRSFKYPQSNDKCAESAFKDLSNPSHDPKSTMYTSHQTQSATPPVSVTESKSPFVQVESSTSCYEPKMKAPRPDLSKEQSPIPSDCKPEPCRTHRQEKQNYGSMLPILSVPKVRLRQDRTGGTTSWTRLPVDSTTLSVGGYFLSDRRREEPESEQGVQSGLDAESSGRVSCAGGSREDTTSGPSLLQMALEHGSTQVNHQADSQETRELRETRKSKRAASVGTCPILPINPKNLREVKPRSKPREKQYYQCQHCHIIYEQSRKLDRHLRDMQGKAPYQCCYCEMSFPTIGCRRFHSRLHEDKTMPCPYCPKIFNEKRRFEDHVRSHTGEAPFMCQECGNVYRTRSALRIHKRTHGSDKPLQCRFCPKRFIRIGDVQVHERTHTGEKPYKCGICESSFATSSQVNRHRRTHSEERPHECSYCSKTFKNPDYLITHEKMHLGHKPHHCKYCPKQFRTPRELVHHERVHTGEKPFECAECGHRFSKKTNLKQHELQHTGIKSFKCARCPKSFYRKASLIWHEKIHENRERFLCKECGKLFFKETSRDKHFQKAHGCGVEDAGRADDDDRDGMEENDGDVVGSEEVDGLEQAGENSLGTPPRAASTKRISPKSPANDGTDSTCEECGKTFLARRSLLRHYRAIHNRYISRNGDGDSPGNRNRKSFACRLCSAKFLTDHLRHVHEGTHTNASFTCDTCKKTFSTRQLLVKHEKIHSKIKPHVCETCGSAFTIKWYLNRHINIVHSDVYSYPCTVCDKKFKAKTALSVHMQLHNVDGNVYNCDQCDAEFHVKRYLARHKRKYHRKDRLGKRAVRKGDDDIGDDDNGPIYDFDDNTEDGFDIMTGDSHCVSGVFLREMLSKGAELNQFDKKTVKRNDSVADPCEIEGRVEWEGKHGKKVKLKSNLKIDEPTDEYTEGKDISCVDRKWEDPDDGRRVRSIEETKVSEAVSAGESSGREHLSRNILGYDEAEDEEGGEEEFEVDQEDCDEGSDQDYLAEDETMSDFDDL